MTPGDREDPAAVAADLSAPGPARSWTSHTLERRLGQLERELSELAGGRGRRSAPRALDIAPDLRQQAELAAPRTGAQTTTGQWRVTARADAPSTAAPQLVGAAAEAAAGAYLQAARRQVEELMHAYLARLIEIAEQLDRDASAVLAGLSGTSHVRRQVDELLLALTLAAQSVTNDAQAAFGMPPANAAARPASSPAGGAPARAERARIS